MLMLMFSLRATIAAALAVLAASPAEAGLFRHRCRSKVVVRQVWRGCVPMAVQFPAQCSGQFAPMAVPSHQAAPQAPAKTYPAPGPVGYGDGPGAFLMALNAWRATQGRGPVGWDAGLAAYAATNSGIHAAGSSGGGSQCWASTPSLMYALRMWQASPAHASILLNATTVIGASPCPSGATCNAR